jgi:hypothetical protein
MVGTTEIMIGTAEITSSSVRDEECVWHSNFVKEMLRLFKIIFINDVSQSNEIMTYFLK